MTTKVNADTSGGLKLTSDTSGTLELQSAGNTKLTVNSSGATIPTISGTTSMSAITGLTSINSGQIGGRRNIIINGAQEVDQRNAGASVAAASVYVTDRWKVQGAGNAGDAEQIDSTIAGFKSSLKYTGDANIAFMQMGQQIEFKNYAHLVGEDVTISFYAKANNTNGGSTALTVRTRTVTGEDGSALFAGANTDTSVTISTTAARYTVARTIPADSKGFSVECVLGAHVNTDGYEITGIQVELGTVTEFEHRSFGEELALCQRYYQQQFTFSAYASNTTTIQASAPCIISMRATPTLSAGGALTVTDGAANYTQSSLTITSVFGTSNGISFNAGNFSGLTQFRPYMSNGATSSVGSLAYSAEL